MEFFFCSSQAACANRHKPTESDLLETLFPFFDRHSQSFTSRQFGSRRPCSRIDGGFLALGWSRGVDADFASMEHTP